MAIVELKLGISSHIIAKVLAPFLLAVSQYFADAAFTQDAERIKWFNQARLELKQGRITALLNSMTTLSNCESSERSKIMTSQINYITKGQVEVRLNYDKIAELKLPLGSGAIESLIRLIARAYLSAIRI